MAYCPTGQFLKPLPALILIPAATLFNIYVTGPGKRMNIIDLAWTGSQVTDKFLCRTGVIGE